MKKIRFCLNKSLDKLMAEDFMNVRGGGIDFSKNIIRDHPVLLPAKLDIEKRKQIINDYFDDYYQNHRLEILETIKLVKKEWHEIEEEYFIVTEKYFNEFEFQPGMYVGYASIINCNPRFLESKTFQFYYKKSVAEIVYTITHELLHFIFFDFVKQQFTDIGSVLSEDELWDLSEIFNVVVLQSEMYKNVIDQNLVLPYPNHKKYITGFSSIFSKTNNAKDFISQSIPLLK